MQEAENIETKPDKDKNIAQKQGSQEARKCVSAEVGKLRSRLLLHHFIASTLHR